MRARSWAWLVIGLACAGGAQAAVIPDAKDAALLIGPDGLGLFAYHDRVNRDLKVAHCVDAACSAVTTVTVDSAGDVGTMAAIAMGPGGPVISYQDATNQTLKLALCSVPLCGSAEVVVVDPNLGDAGGDSGSTAIAVGPDGRALIAYVAGHGLGEVKTAHCEDAACSVATVTSHGGGAIGSHPPSLAIAGDGLGVLSWVYPIVVGQAVAFRHCADVPCTTLTYRSGPQPDATGREVPPSFDGFPSIAIGPDGLPRRFHAQADPSGGGGVGYFRRCLDPLCNTGPYQQVPARYGPAALAVGANGLPQLVVTAAPPSGDGFQLDLIECRDPSCHERQQSCVMNLAEWPTLALDARGQPLVAFERGGGVHVGQPTGSCPTELAVRDAQQTETNATHPSMFFDVGLYPTSSSVVTVDYTFVDGTALGGTGQVGTDYIAYTGTVTFMPGEQAKQVATTIVPDVVPELDETFELVFSNPVNATLPDDRAVGTILNDDDPRVDILDNTCVEGDAGTSACGLEVRLSEPHAKTVTVQFATADGTAVAGSDYVSASGAVTLAPGTLAQTTDVTILGDIVIEPYETVFVNALGAVNGVVGDAQGIAVILDDDTPSLSSIELTHGSSLGADLAAASGPTADRDFYRLAQRPYSSWEIVADQVSGDVAPGLVLERLAEDNSTVLQAGIHAGTGGASVLRWQRRASIPEMRQHISVRSTSCTTDCGPDDTYRLRAYETTGVIPRFNNAGSQTTVLILQNTTDQPIEAHADFWALGGAPLATVPVPLAPHAVGVVSTPAIPALTGKAGSITVTHDGPYGGLVGKAVAVEPSTGLCFDSPMEARPR